MRSWASTPRSSRRQTGNRRPVAPVPPPPRTSFLLSGFPNTCSPRRATRTPVGDMAKAKNLVIVESPTKAKTLQKYLGTGYKVTASRGHIRDLPKSELGVDVERDFAPRYVIPTGSKKT